MRKNIYLLIFVFSISAGLFAQETAKQPVEKSEKRTEQHKPHVDVTMGFLPKTDYNALTAGVAFNNVILKRVGFYTFFAKGLNNNHFSNIIGLTASLNKTFYFFGGFDWFIKDHGVFSHGNFREARKEIGVGILPFKGAVIRLGYSFNAGPSFSVGYKFSL